jgi:DNA-binding SARP family transcriptional activator/tetratricopeptide (TPR) repeat protein
MSQPRPYDLEGTNRLSAYQLGNLREMLSKGILWVVVEPIGGGMETIRLLGPVELWAHGERHDLGSLKEQSVLAVLSLECGRPVSADVLLGQLWDEHPPPRARDTLHSYLSRLRRRLRQTLGDAPQIVSGPGTYALMVDRDAVDLHRFRRLRRQALAIAESGDEEHACTLLHEAEGLWQGEPLAGLPGDWMQRIRESLQEEHRTARVERIEIELRLGRHAGVIGELRRLAAQHPLDEGIAVFLMIALFRCDRQADALCVYQQTRCVLSEELGSEPGARLQDTHQRILRRDPDLAVTPRYRRADHAAQPNTLPSDIADFTGRELELGILTEERDPDKPAMSVHIIEGMPGIGKTALAVRAAHRLLASYPDAQLHLRLREPGPENAAKTASACLTELLRMLGIAPTRIPSTLDERVALWRRETANRRAIIVLDDATGLEQIRPLLPPATACRILVTTRRKLRGLDGAQHVRLDVLPTDEASELFTRLTGNRSNRPGDAVGEIVRRCGCLPLAIRLAAGRFKDSGAAEAADLIEDLIIASAQTTQSSPGDPEIRAAFDLSYRELNTDQQRLFRYLGLAPCHQITEHAAAALSDQPMTILRPSVEVLLNHHLLLDAGQGHVYFHDLIRAYARDLANTEDSSLDRRRSLNRLLDYYLTTADRADRILHPHRRRLDTLSTRTPNVQPVLSTTQQAQRWMEAEWHNALLIAEYAIHHERKKQGALLVHTMAQFLETHGYWEDAAAAHESALQACRGLNDPQGIAQASLELGFIRFRTGHNDAALHHTNEALTIHRSLANLRAEAETLDRIGVIHWSIARCREALAHHQEALALYKSIGDRRGEADALGHSAISHWHLGRYDESISCLRQALQVYRHISDRRGEAMTLNNIGDVEQHRGYHRDAVDLYQRSLEIFEKIAGRQNNAILQNNIGNVYQYKGDYREALRCYRRAIATYQATGDRRNIADALNNIGCTYRLMERYSEALIHHEKALALAEEIADLYERTRALCGIGDIQQETGSYSAALDHYRQALSNAREISDTYQEAKIHDGIASTVLQLHGPQAARIHWRQALDLYETLDVPEAQSVAIRLQTIGGIAS